MYAGAQANGMGVGGGGGEITDGTGTINPAALNSAGRLTASSAILFATYNGIAVLYLSTHHNHM